MIKKIGSVSIALCSILLVGCNNTTNDEKNTEEIVDTVKISTDKVEVEQEELSYNLPSALQIAYVSRKSGAKYNASLLNNIENVKKYNTSNYKRAINFGVYSSDVANCLFNKKYQESKQYLKALKEMGSFLGLNQAFESDNLAERFDKNISNEDTLIKIVSNVQLKTDMLFEQNKQKHITLIAFAGAWIESLNIAGESYLKEKNKKVLDIKFTFFTCQYLFYLSPFILFVNIYFTFLYLFFVSLSNFLFSIYFSFPYLFFFLYLFFFSLSIFLFSSFFACLYFLYLSSFVSLVLTFFCITSLYLFYLSLFVLFVSTVYA